MEDFIVGDCTRVNPASKTFPDKDHLLSLRGGARGCSAVGLTFSSVFPIIERTDVRCTV